ncbi:MAG: serine/threonine protein kinase [Anaerolineae bacterium]|nr:serine/threonine protein kinase [Anaerolineae bacterium]
MDGNIGKFLGKYQIVEPLGEGGMATVYKAYDAALERYVAVKIIRSINQVDPNFLARFQREAKALAKLDHPYILKVLDYGEENGIPYLVMPYVARGTLKQVARSRIGYRKAIELLIPIGEALSYAHRQKIIHRDIKPANILFGESGEPVLSDFGIAKMIDAGDETQLTSAGVGVGTPDYMAPEQWNGVADERTDVYALGIVLYELVTGRCPYHADTPAAILLKQVQDPLPRPKNAVPDLPDAVEGLLLKALAKDPALRFQTMNEFVLAMNRILRGDLHQDDFDASTLQSKGERRPEVSMPGIQHSSSREPVKPLKKKWVPLAIGGGILLSIGCLVVIVLTILWQSGMFGKQAETQIPGLNPATPDQEEATLVDLEQDQALATATPSDLAEPTATVGSVSKIEKLPADIPVYQPNNGDVMTSEAEEYLIISYSTGDDHEKVEAYFTSEMENLGWSLENTTAMSSQNLMMYVFAKEERNVLIYVMADQPARTTLQIMLPAN